MIMNNQGNLTDSIEELVEELFKNHFPFSKITPRYEKHQTTVTAPHIKWINPDNFRAVFAQFKSNKATGTDKIKPNILKNLPDGTILRLCTLFSASIEVGCTPKIWRTSRRIYLN
jgi:hypothetical protein